MKKGRVLVTGAGGFNGRYILKLLKEKGYTPRATDLPTGERTATPDFYKNIGVEFIPSDLTKPETLAAAVKDVDCVMHVASLFDYSAPLGLNRKVNVEGMRNLCEACKEAGVKKMILWGTIGVYGEQEEMPITENSPPNPGNAYEISKLEQEHVALEYSDAGDFVVTVIRPAPVYGPGNRYGFINIVKLSTLSHHVIVPEKMETRLPSVHVKDVARCGVFLMEAPDRDVDGEVYTLIDDSNILLPEFLHLIAGLLGKPTIRITVDIPLEAVLTAGHMAANVSEKVSKHITHVRPVIEDATVYYMKFDYIYSNQKLKDLGFDFQYPDCRVGLIEMTDWIKSEDMEPLRIKWFK